MCHEQQEDGNSLDEGQESDPRAKRRPIYLDVQRPSVQHSFLSDDTTAVVTHSLDTIGLVIDWSVRNP